MKQLFILLALMLSACQQERPEDGKPEVEVKVQTTETPEESPEDIFDSERYKAARQCLLAGPCDHFTDTPEYTRAWNNLAAEGYLCQNNHCTLDDLDRSTSGLSTEIQPEVQP